MEIITQISSWLKFLDLLIFAIFLPKDCKYFFSGSANYEYQIVQATNNAFKVKAIAITDFDVYGVFNVWEIDQDKRLKEIIKD